MTGDEVKKFRKTIYDFYEKEGRVFPWRETTDPYRITVSEVMLQQTPTGRVLGKYNSFLAKYHGFPELAEASLDELLTLWKGLGYSRRAKGLRDIARIVVNDFGGILPRDPAVLRTFPMLGAATSCSIVTFAYNIPTLFIEVNIRRVFLHFFFPEKENVKDRDIMHYVEAALDRDNPRIWYFALMDYGVKLKNENPLLHKRSAHYARQKPFTGSNRQIRGEVLALASEKGSFTSRELYTQILGPGPGKPAVPLFSREAVDKAVGELISEGFLVREEGFYMISR